MANQNRPFNIVDFCNIVKTSSFEQIEKVLNENGIPEEQPGVNTYLLLQSLLKNKLLKIAKLLIKAGCRINPTLYETGLTPLGLAFTYQYLEIAQLLMKHGAKIYTDVTKNKTVLHLAVETKSLKMLQFIIKYVNVDTRDSNDKTAIEILFNNYPFRKLGHTVRQNEIEMVRLLLKKGASVDFKNSDGKTALHCVASLKQKDIIKSVLERTVNVNLCDNQGRSALHYLLMTNYESENDVFDIVKLFIQKRARLDIADHHGITIAHIAAKKKYLTVLNKFLQFQCNVSCKDSEGNTLLHKLLKCSAHLSGNKDCMNLVESILSIAPLVNSQNCSGETPMYLAAKNHHYKLLEKMLLRCQDNDVNITDGDCQETLLHVIAKQFCNQNLAILKCLLNAGANVDIKNVYGVTPIDMAFRRGNKQLLLPLLRSSKNLKEYHIEEKSVLHYLGDIQVDTESEELEVAKIAKMCINQGIHVDAPDNFSGTPLRAAVFKQRTYLVKILLELGANPNLSTSSIGVIQYLVSKRSLSSVDLEIADILVSKGADIVITFDHLLTLLKHIHLRESIIKLLNNCENLNLLDAEGNTALHSLLNNKNAKDIVFPLFKAYLNLFLSKGVSMDAKNKNNLTLISLAAKNNHNSVYELLLRKSASNVLQRVAKSALVDQCTEKIFKFLNNQDLINLIRTAPLKTGKRKSVCSTGIKMECTAPKRLQR